jgi:hypothetical protein
MVLIQVLELAYRAWHCGAPLPVGSETLSLMCQGTLIETLAVGWADWIGLAVPLDSVVEFRTEDLVTEPLTVVAEQASVSLSRYGALFHPAQLRRYRTIIASELVTAIGLPALITCAVWV